MHDAQHQIQLDSEQSKKASIDATSSQSEGSLVTNIGHLRAGTPRQNQTIRRQAATRLSQQLGNQAFIRRMVAPSIQRDEPSPTSAPSTPSTDSADTTADEGPHSYFSAAFAGHIQTANNFGIELQAEAEQVGNALEMYAAGANALAGQTIQGEGAPPELKAEGHTARDGLSHMPKAIQSVNTSLDSAKATWYADNPQYNQ